MRYWRTARDTLIVSGFVLLWMFVIVGVAAAQSRSPAQDFQPGQGNYASRALISYPKWSAGSYTKAIWDAQSLASGNWTDSVSSIVLTVTGSPTYLVPGIGGYKAWNGVTTGSGKYFLKTTGSSQFDLASGTHAVIQAVFKVGSVNSYHVPFSDGDGTSTGIYMYYFAVYNGDPAQGYWLVKDNSSNSAGGLFTRTNPLATGQMIKLRVKFHRLAGATYIYENGVLVYQINTSAVTGSFTNPRISIGIEPDVAWATDWTMYALKIDTSTSLPVTIVNNGGPGGG